MTIQERVQLLVGQLVTQVAIEQAKNDELVVELEKAHKLIRELEKVETPS